MKPATVQTLFREYAALDRRRRGDGLTPSEHRRWQELKQRLAEEFSAPPSTGDRRESVRVPTRIRVSFRSKGHVRHALIRNISQGGLFINTPFALEIGTEFLLNLQIRSTGETLEIPVTVVSTHVGDGFSTEALGMGVKFTRLAPEQRKQLDELYSPALSTEADDSEPD